MKKLLLVKSYLISFASILCFAPTSHAITISSSSEASSNTFSQTLGLSSQTTDENQTLYLSGWSVRGEGNRTQQTDTNGNKTILTGRSGEGSISLGYKDFLELSAGVNASNTPELAFKDQGTTVGMTFSHSFSARKTELGESVQAEDVESTEIFAPHFSIGAFSGKSEISQEVDIVIFNRNIKRSVQILRYSVTADLSLSLFESLDLRYSQTNYTYDRTKADLVTASQSRFLNVKASSLVNTIFGLPESSSSTGFTYYFSPIWDVSLDITRTTNYVDGAVTQDTSLELSKLFTDKLKIAIAITRSKIEEDVYSSGKLNLRYRF